MIPSWAGKMLLRLGFLALFFALLLGGVWRMTGNARQSSADVQTPAEPPVGTQAEAKGAAASPPTAATAKPPHLIEVDLSKLPPDLVKELQGAIVEKPARRPASER